MADNITATPSKPSMFGGPTGTTAAPQSGASTSAVSTSVQRREMGVVLPTSARRGQLPAPIIVEEAPLEPARQALLNNVRHALKHYARISDHPQPETQSKTLAKRPKSLQDMVERGEIPPPADLVDFLDNRDLTRTELLNTLRVLARYDPGAIGDQAYEVAENLLDLKTTHGRTDAERAAAPDDWAGWKNDSAISTGRRGEAPAQPVGGLAGLFSSAPKPSTTEKTRPLDGMQLTAVALREDLVRRERKSALQNLPFDILTNILQLTTDSAEPALNREVLAALGSPRTNAGAHADLLRRLANVQQAALDRPHTLETMQQIRVELERLRGSPVLGPALVSVMRNTVPYSLPDMSQWFDRSELPYRDLAVMATALCIGFVMALTMNLRTRSDKQKNAEAAVGVGLIAVFATTAISAVSKSQSQKPHLYRAREAFDRLGGDPPDPKGDRLAQRFAQKMNAARLAMIETVFSFADSVGGNDHAELLTLLCEVPLCVRPDQDQGLHETEKLALLERHVLPGMSEAPRSKQPELLRALLQNPRLSKQLVMAAVGLIHHGNAADMAPALGSAVKHLADHGELDLTHAWIEKDGLLSMVPDDRLVVILAPLACALALSTPPRSTTALEALALPRIMAVSDVSDPTRDPDWLLIRIATMPGNLLTRRISDAKTVHELRTALDLAYSLANQLDPEERRTVLEDGALNLRRITDVNERLAMAHLLLHTAVARGAGSGSSKVLFHLTDSRMFRGVSEAQFRDLFDVLANSATSLDTTEQAMHVDRLLDAAQFRYRHPATTAIEPDDMLRDWNIVHVDRIVQRADDNFPPRGRDLGLTTKWSAIVAAAQDRLTKRASAQAVT